MRNSADAIIIGAGIVGVATARALARAGLSVVLCDRGAPCAEASSAAAGMLAPQIETEAEGPLLELGLAARSRYQSLAAELAEAGHDIGYWPGGIARVAFDEMSAVTLRSRATAQRRIGLDSEWLESKELRRRHPLVSPEARGALLAPRDGCVDPRRLNAALIAEAAGAGVEFARREVCEVTSAQGRVTGVRTELDAFHAPAVVVAAGAWSGALVGLPHGAAVAPVRGQMAAVAWPADQPPAILFGDAGYVVARGGEALLGSTMEHAGFVNETTPEGLAHIRAQAAALVPALRDAPFTRTWSGLRPVSADGLPIIGTDPDLEGVVFATGHGRNGILLAPLTADIVCELVAHGETRWDLAPYSVTRF